MRFEDSRGSGRRLDCLSKLQRLCGRRAKQLLRNGWFWGISLFKCLTFCPPAAGSPGSCLAPPARRSLIAYSAIAYKPQLTVARGPYAYLRRSQGTPYLARVAVPRQGCFQTGVMVDDAAHLVRRRANEQLVIAFCTASQCQVVVRQLHNVDEVADRHTLLAQRHMGGRLRVAPSARAAAAIAAVNQPRCLRRRWMR